MRLLVFRSLIVAAALAACSAPQSAQSVNEHAALASAEEGEAATPARAQEDPVARIRRAYRSFEEGDDVPDTGDQYSRSLVALFEADQRESAGEIGRLDFDPWINGQDWTLSGVEVSEAPREGGRRIVIARFRNSGTLNVIRFELVEEGGRWLIDDMVSTPPEGEGWRLREILTGPL